MVESQSNWHDDYTNPDVEPYWLQEKPNYPYVKCLNQDDQVVCTHRHCQDVREQQGLFERRDYDK